MSIDLTNPIFTTKAPAKRAVKGAAGSASLIDNLVQHERLKKRLRKVRFWMNLTDEIF